MRRPIPYYLRGCYHEMDDNGRLRFFEIHHCPYSPESVQRLKAIDCLEESRLWRFMRLIKGDIPDDTLHLYKLTTYIGKPGIDDAWEFASNCSQLENFGFIDIDSLLQYCSERWGVKKEDFKPVYETNIPH